MIKIEVILNKDHLEDVLRCISDLEISMLNFYEVSSIGNHIEQATIYRGVSHSSSYTSKTKLEILTTSDKVLQFKACLENLVKDNGHLAPIEIFVSEINEAYQIS